MLRAVAEVRVNWASRQTASQHLERELPGVDAGGLLQSMEGLAASAGAACHGNSVELSRTLRALAVPIEWARGTIRLSTGKYTTEGEVGPSCRDHRHCRETAQGRGME
ncbi:MAG: hypothetical protein MZV70_12950 [Desulfobacterales bacterium]|nr:hypothetical protein [Desulfobacterales bacterium]